MKERIKNPSLRRSQKDYSLAFKLQVINEVEKGQLSYKEAQRKYGIQGRSTVLVWLRKHGRLDWKSAQPMKGKEPPGKKLRQLEAKIRRLEAEKEILNRTIDLSDELFGTDIRKKHSFLLSTASKLQEPKEQDPSS